MRPVTSLLESSSNGCSGVLKGPTPSGIICRAPFSKPNAGPCLAEINSGEIDCPCWRTTTSVRVSIPIADLLSYYKGETVCAIRTHGARVLDNDSAMVWACDSLSQ